ncbi:MAG: molecular chaperone DnaJ [Sulfuricurvum sp. GWF2_44_89]|jgi:DnaJ-class molecular chaperone|uniref:Molecular chaperone DnaJ n=2 Tax=Sulfuricurvum TaxID=286130 RepID=A0A2D3WGT6_9BACT|nr:MULTISPECIES: J domain-containing protein [Sulfuricurvum]OHD77559.1 MAG: molecular chaperone DnaJ [Sulfuricurvum sp. GWF2_44_89]OHD93203.1 MAG: molecular chaperone DnaJ [Sulfuricurvum sp. RIFOXYD12_FULL_44_77]OHD92242.1 MAG: molecular chaperone DnaJ [Sulfuricurvum sp. RIFOXYD2_FULL_44_160]DAB38290.1 MAG TPA: molecular chaperone DnaJ [Sulfuricurvum kujiense]DAB38417.1 MAG TPA: molecular chaperone DnaJ [Sulfuricurvum kujiense]
MLSFDTLIKAKTLLGLSDKATLSDIKTRYKNMMQQWHPDKHPDDTDTAHAMSTQINEAYAILLEYCSKYEFNFDEEHLREKTLTPQEWWTKKFGGR